MKIKKIFDDNNLIIQQKSYTCGPVSLLNILGKKGDFSHDEDELENLCGAKAGLGTTHANLLKAAKEVGLTIMEEKENATLNDIERNIDAGYNVVVNYWDAFCDVGHYSPIEEYDGRAYYFCDCSLGFLRLDKEDFEKNWYGQSRANPSRRWFVALS